MQAGSCLEVKFAGQIWLRSDRKSEFTAHRKAASDLTFYLYLSSARLFPVSIWFDGLSSFWLHGAVLKGTVAHTPGCRLPLWSSSPFVIIMLMKAPSVSAVHPPGRILMSSIFDHYRRPAWCSLFFPLILSFMGDVAWLCVTMFTFMFKCVYVWGWRGGRQKGGGGQLIGSFFFFLKGGKMTIIIFNPPSQNPSEMRFFLFRVRWKQLGTGIEQKVPSDHKQTFRWITSKALPQLLALSYLRKIGSLRAKKWHCLH